MEDERSPLKLSVIGAGYVGLVTAACLARMGHHVRCVDRDGSRIADLNRGILPFREPGLDEAVAEGLAHGRLTFSDDPAATHGSDAVLVAVGTLDEGGEWTDRYAEDAVLALVGDGDAPRTIIVRSTLMPGTTARLATEASTRDPRVELAFNPEFTRQGSAVRDFFTPDRIVVGTTRPAADSRALDLLTTVYADLNAPLICTDATSAELIKVGANTFLALKISFANELARVAAATDANIATVADGLGMDRRIGRDFLSVGPGFGGSCLPSQARALGQLADDRGVETPIVASIDASNQLQAGWVVDQLERQIGGLTGARVTVLGLTFKAGTDDLRESRALEVCHALARRGAKLTVHDPLALEQGVAALAANGTTVDAARELENAFEGADAAVVATEWPAYRAIDWGQAAAVMAGRTVLDARGVIDHEAAASAGLNVLVHGRRVPAAGAGKPAPSS